jgi:acetylornithine deacetylase
MMGATADVLIDREFVIQKLTDLVRINSVNPGLVDGAPGEAEIGEYIYGELRSLNLPAEVLEIEPGRVNVVASVPGSGGGRSLMLNAHMDTVGVEGMSDPFSGVLRDGKVFGRGSQDMKGSIAAMLGTARAMVESNTRMAGDVVFAFVADEEMGSIGTEHLVGQVKTDAAIVTEPSDLDICLAHKGFHVFEFETVGRAAHGGCPEDGVDANMYMGRILGQLDGLSQSLSSGRQHTLLGAPSLHVPLMAGGDQLFIYAAKSRISVERRTIPGESQEDVLTQMEDLLRGLREADPSFEGSVRSIIGREPYEVPPDAGIVKALGRCAEVVLGRTPEFIGHTWWEDSALLGAAGTETVIYGPTGSGIHTSEEWVDVASVVSLARILMLTAAEYCG